MERERSAAAAMLGMAGFVVLAVSEHDGELEQAIETSADLVGCPECGAGHHLDPAARWTTGVDGGLTQVRFTDASGSIVGCVHLNNGALPASGAPPQTIKVSAYSPCRS